MHEYNTVDYTHLYIITYLITVSLPKYLSDVPATLICDPLKIKLIHSYFHMPTYLTTYLPTCLPTYLLTYLPTYLPAYLPTHLLTYPFAYFHDYTTHRHGEICELIINSLTTRLKNMPLLSVFMYIVKP